MAGKSIPGECWYKVNWGCGIERTVLLTRGVVRGINCACAVKRDESVKKANKVN
jgi:hypothetical protein